MKLTCKIIQDLLPLYSDDICSDDSRKLIEEHIENCEDCRKILENMNSKLQQEDKEDNIDEAKALKNISEEINTDKKKSVLKAIIITTVILSIIFMFTTVKFV